MRTDKLFFVAAGSVFLSGCVTPMLMQHPVKFNSEPPGAAVTYDGKTIGTTPFVYDVRDVFGFFTAYTFTARMPDRKDVILTFEEPTLMHAQGIVPNEVRFTFGEPRSNP